MLLITKKKWVYFLILFFCFVENTSCQEKACLKDIDFMLGGFDTILLSNKSSNEDKTEYLWSVYSLYMQSSNDLESSLAEAIFIFITKYSSAYHYYLFDNRLKDTCKGNDYKQIAFNKTEKFNRLFSILFIRFNTCDPFYYEEFRKTSFYIKEKGIDFEKELAPKKDCLQDMLLIDGFNFNNFMNLIESYVCINELNPEVDFEIKKEKRDEIIKLLFILKGIYNSDSKLRSK